ncbi:MAG: hypothetical protein AAF208_01340 [Cyanobacteria bacterium P01_A01_bin.45]
MTNYLEQKLRQKLHRNKQKRPTHPLIPIKESDLKALDSLFKNIDGEELIADISKNLHRIDDD